MSVVCHRCKERVDEADVKREIALAQCKACRLVFDPTHDLQSQPEDRDLIARPIVSLRTRVPMPPHWEVDVDEPVPLSAPKGGYRSAANVVQRAELEAHRKRARAKIRFRWTPKVLSQWLVALLTTMIGTGLCAAVMLDGVLGSHVVWSQAIFGAVFFVLFALIVWLTLGQVVNSTTITLADGTLRIEEGPIWRSVQNTQAADIEQIFCLTTWETVGEKFGTSRRAFYSLEAALIGDHTIRLMRTDSPEQALYLEQVLEHALGIVDVALPNTTRPCEPQEDPEAGT